MATKKKKKLVVKKKKSTTKKKKLVVKKKKSTNKTKKLKVNKKKSTKKKSKKLKVNKKKTTKKKAKKTKVAKAKPKKVSKKKTTPRKTKPAKKKTVKGDNNPFSVKSIVANNLGSKNHGSPFNADSKSDVNKRCYLKNNVTGGILRAQFNPTSIPYGRSANYATIESPGMAYPLTQFVNGNVRQFSFELFFYDKPFTGRINTARKFLEALLPPESNSKSFTKPPTFKFAYGYFVKTLVLEQLDIDDSWLDGDGQPLQTTFTLTVRQVGK